MKWHHENKNTFYLHMNPITPWNLCLQKAPTQVPLGSEKTQNPNIARIWYVAVKKISVNSTWKKLTFALTQGNVHARKIQNDTLCLTHIFCIRADSHDKSLISIFNFQRTLRQNSSVTCTASVRCTSHTYDTDAQRNAFDILRPRAFPSTLSPAHTRSTMWPHINLYLSIVMQGKAGGDDKRAHFPLPTVWLR